MVLVLFDKGKGPPLRIGWCAAMVLGRQNQHNGPLCRCHRTVCAVVVLCAVAVDLLLLQL
jgi:hypothetical protein